MSQLVVCLVTAIDNVFDHKDGCKVIDLRCWVAVVSARTVFRLARNTCGGFKLAWRHLPCWYCSVPRWGPTWLPARGIMQPVPLPQVFPFRYTVAHDSSSRCPPSLPLCSSTLALGVFFIDGFLNTCHRHCRFSTPLHFAFTSQNTSYSLTLHTSFSLYVRGVIDK